MMDSDILPQSLGFLTDAAHLLMKTAPETSAYIMAQRNSLMFSNGLEQSDMQRQHVCGGCGQIMIPGQGSELKIETNKAIQKKKKQKNSKTSKSPSQKPAPVGGCRKQLNCGMCNRYTNIAVPQAPPISRRRAIPAKSLSLGASQPVKVSANASSKKRAKGRKQGLQALLQQAQSSASKPQNGLGLSLSDFMLK
ncbi:hypothetical protein GGR54DRAFT_21335 [Hypoxylon sp. NC1633]|nr:hypothetical protein GGR54DRAFT_21335 [Hypoxylon sp. NC1633]